MEHETLLRISQLVRAGYPFSKDDLSIDTWQLLAVVAEEHAASRG